MLRRRLLDGVSDPVAASSSGGRRVDVSRLLAACGRVCDDEGAQWRVASGADGIRPPSLVPPVGRGEWDT